MPDIAIKVENLSKRYELGSIGTGSLARDIQRWWAMAKGNEDPYAIVNHNQQVDNSKEHWALKDVSFEIKQGEAVGIIGKNGAGKSTLLKILSRVTTPTSGSIKVKGRIASLLEVGTGFHGDLSGRENIFMNGAILGMSKAEIRSKLDEIIDFSGVENYIDTPVKRYSSGMYVRLAFAVAAHLEPDILVVDEVLAVGDAEFQKKCLGKMNDVSKKEGRTVIFVSHNMSAISTLCTIGLTLQNGECLYLGEVNTAIEHYFKKNIYASTLYEHPPYSGSFVGLIHKVVMSDLDGNIIPDRISIHQSWKLSIDFELTQNQQSFILAVGIVNKSGTPVRTIFSQKTSIQKGMYNAVIYSDNIIMASDHYKLIISISNHGESLHTLDDKLSIIIEQETDEKTYFNSKSNTGFILNPIPVLIKQIT
jgi:lipopolysaccharide transport system ATP-binding protein